MADVQFGPPRERVSVGLKNGKDFLFECSKCGKPLYQIKVVNPDADVEWRTRVKCCYCGDHSFIREFRGLYAHSGYGIPDPNDPQEAIPVTEILEFKTETDSQGKPVLTVIVGAKK